MLLYLLSLLIVGASAGSYLITAPRTIQPGSNFVVSVDILNTTGVEVSAELQDYRYNGSTGRTDVLPILKRSGIFNQGTTGSLSLAIDRGIECPRCRVHIRGRGGLQFERNLNSRISSDVVATLVQTDKAIYKPGQTVRFRAFAVYPSLRLFQGSFNIEIKDPMNNKIKVLNNLRSPSGVVEDEMELSDQPLFGAWSITVILNGVTERYTQTFDVADYELPRFEVKVNLPPYGLLSESKLTGSVEAKYTFGQPVQGMVELHVGPNRGPNSCGDLPKTTQIAFEIDGNASFSVPKADIQRAVNLYNNVEVKVTAFVKEGVTGVRLNGSAIIKYYRNEHKVKFTDNTPNVFKPGLPYTAFIQVTTPDDLPPARGNNMVSVYTYVNYRLTVDDQDLYGIGSFSGTYPLPGQNITLPANGLLPVDVAIPSNATSINIRATFRDVRASMTVEKMYSKSNNFIQLSLLDKNVKAKSTVRIKLDGTEPLNDVNYKVLSRGVPVVKGTQQGQGQKSFTFDLPVTAAMAPTAHLIAYYAKNFDEIIADSIAFNVDGIFQNEVTVAFSKNESQPAEAIDVVVTADPQSQVNLLAVDQSVLLLKSGNDVTPEKVNDAVSKFDAGEKPSGSEFALSYSAKAVNEVFSDTGLEVVTDVQLSNPEIYMYPPLYPGQTMAPGMSMGGGGAMPYPTVGPMQPNFGAPTTAAPANSPLKEVSRVRLMFPEAWLWSMGFVSDNGTAVFSTTVPDTVTSWVASAFAVHPTSGLGVAPVTAKLRVFRPFFVSLTYPSSITRGEQAVIQATVFNYLPQDTRVVVTLRGSSGFQFVRISSSGLEVLEIGDQVVNVDVQSDDQGVVYFPILATSIGVIDIEIAAQSTVAADAVRRQIVVEPEGARVDFSYPVFINIDANTANNQFNDLVALPLPQSVVPGSDRARIKVTGDLIGASLDNMDSLLRLPTGCGEQSMVKFSPNLFVIRYLNATGQLTGSLERKIVRNLEFGYQRQLTYQRTDGGFGTFGNYDESGSTWLTAYVIRDLSDAREFIYVDPNLLVRGVEWLVDRQNRDGSFNEFGRVLDRNIQGTGTGPALTGQVLLALLQNRDLNQEQECLNNNRRCSRFYRWNNATAKAIGNLEALVDRDSISELFALSVVSYALTQAQSPKADVAFQKLLQSATVAGGLTYWSANATATRSSDFSRYLIWRPPRIQPQPIDVLITSYAILTYTANNQLDEGFSAVRWLTAQRNSLGGFVSSQDTSVGLQALSAYASKAIRPDTQINVKVSDQTVLADFNIDRSNALVLQVQELNSAPQKANIQATGTGFALLAIDTSFYVTDELTTPSFDVSTVLLDDDIDSFNLMICTKWLWDRDTGMVVQEVKIPSGFQPDLDSLSNVAGLKRSERKGDFVEIYFERITKTSICYSIMMTRSAKVAKSQRSYIRTYDYYQPGDQSTVFWQPKKLRDSTICDVCDGCCP